jgi:hypothetical protein
MTHPAVAQDAVVGRATMHKPRRSLRALVLAVLAGIRLKRIFSRAKVLKWYRWDMGWVYLLVI